MATTKGPEEIDKDKEAVTVAVPESQAVEPKPAQVNKPKNKQTMTTIAIVSAVVLFFGGLGLGYLLGHMTAIRRMPMNGLQFPGDNDGGRRFYPNGSTRNSTNSGNNSTTTPQTETN